ncbi:MAG TPA: lysylphosphatidylglycerol synthase transmembrane domain-containing protein [Candidatus Binatia bacterium]|nr:lysylphosphatidylglycerol synthase transmembrane domain-containing protein [Candidatus Binatia bacterium]
MVGGLVAFVIYLYFFIGIPKILRVLSDINSSQYAFYYSLALACVLASVFVWSTAWNSILRTLSINISYRNAYLYYWASYFADLVLPCATLCGEITRLYLVEKETRKDYGILAASAITNRIVAYAIVTIGLFTGATLIFLKPGISTVISNVFVLFLVAITVYMVALLYLAFVESAARNFSKLYGKIFRTLRPTKYQPESETQREISLAAYYTGFKKFRERPVLLIRPFVLHGISYLLGLFSYIFIFYALEIPSTPEFYVIVFFIATAVQDAVASFSVGSLDIILASIFILYGLNPGLSGITALLVRSVGFWFPLLMGFVAFQYLQTRNFITQKQLEKSPRVRVDLPKQ